MKILFKIILTVWFVYIMLPVIPVYDYNILATLYIILCYIFLFSGIYLYEKYINNTKNSKLTFKKLKNIYLYYYLGILAFIFRLIDRFILREVGFGLSFDQILLNLESTSPTIFGVIGGFGLFFCYVPFLSELLQRKNRLKYTIVFFLPVIDTLLIGQRFQVLTALVLFIIAYFYNRKITLAKTFYIGRIFIFALIIAVALIIIRYNNHGVELYTSLTWSGYAETLKPNQWVLEGESESLIFFYLKFIISNIGQYLYHGIHEFSYMIDKGVSGGIKYGTWTFDVPVKLLELLIGYEPNYWDGLPHKGIYLSYFGIMYIDFGFFGILFQFFLGILWGYANKMVRIGNKSYILLFAYLSYIIVLMPVTSMISYGLGNYILITATLVIIIDKYKIKLGVKKLIYENSYFRFSNN